MDVHQLLYELNWGNNTWKTEGKSETSQHCLWGWV